jgi:AraC-like DNA-binding protein
MDYREYQPPEALRPFVKAGWTLEAGGRPGEWLRHDATPDGTIEIIRRLCGLSVWGGPQPETFVAGLVTAPAPLRLSGEAGFVGIRLWPWAWNAVAILPSPALVDRWSDLGAAAPGFAMPATVAAAFEALADRFRALSPPTPAAAILAARNAAELASLSGWPARRLQRWFAREIGVGPRTYLRLLRFQQTFAALPASADSLADHAAAHGFSDQAHMAREFRVLAGAPASRARRSATPPFV